MTDEKNIKFVVVVEIIKKIFLKTFTEVKQVLID